MKKNPRIAKGILVIAGIALVAAIVLALIKLAALTGLYNPGQDNITRWLQLSLGLAVLFAAVYAIIEPDKARILLTGRQAKYGSNAALSIVAFVLILVLINWYAYKNPMSKDLTEDKQNTLAPETVQMLESLPQPINAIAFFSTAYNATEERNLLDQFKSNSNKRFDYQVVDPELEPLTAQQYGATDGTIIFMMGDSSEQVSFATEEEFDAALVRLLYPAERVIYFLAGHGEASLDPNSEYAVSNIGSALERKNYTVLPLNLIATPNIPADALAIIIAGPVQPVSQVEVDMLKAYVDAGGSLLVMEEPVPLTEYGDAPDPLAQYLQQDWGITLENDIVVDTATNQPLVAVANEYAVHPITDKLRGVVSVFPTARSITVATDVSQDMDPVELIRTSSDSWGETDLASLESEGVLEFSETDDKPGPVVLAAAVENYLTSARVVVFGDSEFAQDAMYATYGNGDLIINSIDWVAQQENLIALTPKTQTDRVYNLPSQGQTLAIVLGSVCLIPLLVVIAGVTSWVIRKRKG